MPEAPSPSQLTNSPSESERDEILSLLADTIRGVHGDIKGQEPTNLDEEKLQLRRMRTFGYLTGQYRKLLKDTDIDEMEDELALLQEAVNVKEDDR